MTKSEQLKKHKEPNPKKMDKATYRRYVDKIREYSDGMCQGDGCENEAKDIHHGAFGRDKDDRTITAICMYCHYTIHHGTDTDRKKARTDEFLAIGWANWQALGYDFCD